MGAKSRSKGCCSWFIVIIVLALVVGAIVYATRKKSNHSDGAVASDENYSDALKIAMQFFDVQKSGKLVDNKISWRGDSALEDGSDAKLDLSKGMYDAGDAMKFGFPMAFTATMLSWAILEYGSHMEDLNQLDAAQDSLRWITDYLINAHPSPNVLYIQVGDPEEDHKCWQKPESMIGERPLTQVNTSTPGTEVAAETAAAMASASLVFKTKDSTYSSTLLKHAQQLFTFADKYIKSYSVSNLGVQKYYNSTGYGDELLWAASWLYHATKNSTYLQYTVKYGDNFTNWGNPTWFSWDNKLAGTQVLLSRISFLGDASDDEKESLDMYKKTAEAVMCGLIPDSPTATKSRTDSGLIWVSEWNALQHPVASAYLAVLYSDYMLASETEELSCDGTSYGPSDLRTFAKSQANYVLGQNPNKMSYLVGYGDDYPQYVHHRGASIPADAETGCSDGMKWFHSKKPNPNVAIGAMVGGPFLNETYNDDRDNFIQGEPSTYNSALIVGLLSSLAGSSVAKSFT